MMNSKCSGSITKYSTPLQMKDRQIWQNTDETHSFYSFKIRHQKVSYQFYICCMMTQPLLFDVGQSHVSETVLTMLPENNQIKVLKGWF